TGIAQESRVRVAAPIAAGHTAVWRPRHIQQQQLYPRYPRESMAGNGERLGRHLGELEVTASLQPALVPAWNLHVLAPVVDQYYIIEPAGLPLEPRNLVVDLHQLRLHFAAVDVADQHMVQDALLERRLLEEFTLSPARPVFGVYNQRIQNP